MKFVSKLVKPGEIVAVYSVGELDEREEYFPDTGKLALIGLKREVNIGQDRMLEKVPLWPFRTVPSVLNIFTVVAERYVVEEVYTCGLISRILTLYPEAERQQRFQIAMWGLLQYVEAFQAGINFDDWKAGWIQAFTREDRLLMIDLLSNGKYRYYGKIHRTKDLDPRLEENLAISLYVQLLLLISSDYNIDPGQILFSLYLSYGEKGISENPIAPDYPAKMVEVGIDTVFFG